MSAALLAGCTKARPLVEQGSACTGCHGGTTDLTGLAAAAPPLDTHGQDTSAAVGAHTKHLASGVTCDTCHLVPSGTGDAEHRDDATPDHAELTFGPAAKTNGAQPAYDYTAHTCSNTYCHAPKSSGGIDLGGGTPAPGWSDGALGCSGCHAYPPLAIAPHKAGSTDCSGCHPDTVASDDHTLLADGKHLNGQSDATMTGCSACHGDASRTVVDGRNAAAPPVDIDGLDASPQIGAHQIHLEGGPGALAKPFRCEECHVYPGDLSHAGTRPAEITFGGPIGTKAGRAPSYAAGRTCNNTYCHNPTVIANGVALDLGGTKHDPAWDGDASQVACGTCHASPPTAAPHPQVDANGAAFTGTAQCNQCHPSTVNPDGTLFVSNGAHVNGQLDVNNYHPAGFDDPAVHGLAANFHDAAFPSGLATCKTCHGNDLAGGIVNVSCNACHASHGHPSWQTSADGCTFCHGNANRSSAKAAPPEDTLKHQVATDRGVGAHQTHLFGRSTGAISGGVACTSCHATPGYGDIGHVDGATPTKLVKPGTATVAGTFNATNATCSSTYCHGNFPNGTSGNNPVWTQTDGQRACNVCHPSAPTSGHHPAVFAKHSGLACKACHAVDYASTSTSVVKTNHVNGVLNVGGTGSSITSGNWNASNKSCAPACHGTETW